MNEQNNEQIIAKELNEAAELIKSPEIQIRQMGARMLARIALSAIETEAGGQGLAGIIRVEACDATDADATEKAKVEYENKKSLELCHSLVGGINDVIFSLDLEGNLSYVSPIVEGYSGYDRDELIGLPFSALIHPDDLPGMANVFRENLVGKNKPFEFRVIDKNNNIRWMRVSSNILLSDGRPSGVAGIMMDITDRKVLEEKLINLSLVDALTGLRSRHYLEEYLHIVKNSRRYPVSIINIDVDGLRDVNNNYGHDAGDRMLKVVGKVLKGAFRQEDCVARSGGDEFLIVLPETDAAGARVSIERINAGLEIYNIENADSTLSLSIGLATANNITDWDQTLKNADDLMYEQKELHKLGADVRSSVFSQS